MGLSFFLKVFLKGKCLKYLHGIRKNNSLPPFPPCNILNKVIPDSVFETTPTPMISACLVGSLPHQQASPWRAGVVSCLARGSEASTQQALSPHLPMGWGTVNASRAPLPAPRPSSLRALLCSPAPLRGFQEEAHRPHPPH